MTGLRDRWLAVGFVVLIFSAPAKADAKADYEAIFGEEAKRVEATRGAEDDAAFAAKLLSSARRLDDSPDLRNLVLEKAFRYGVVGPGGLETAEAALHEMGRYRANRKSTEELAALRVELYESRFRLSSGRAKIEAGTAYVELLVGRADAEAARGNAAEADKLYLTALPVAQYVRSPRATEIIATRRRMAEQMEAARTREARLAELQARFKENPKSASARRNLLLHYLLDRNLPDEAAKLVAADLDESLRTYVPLTLKPLGSLSEGVCLELGGWYEELAKTATADGRRTAFSRAIDCFRQYLRLHSRQDAPALKVRLSLANIEKALGKGYVSPPTLPSTSSATPAGSASPTQGGPPKALLLQFSKGVTMKLVLVPAGKFLMGSPDSDKDARDDEKPQHEVTISKPLYLGATEVTQGQWKAVMGTEPWKGRPCVKEGDDHAANHLNWDDATAFCEKLSRSTGRRFRLPTEAEWEYACRAGTTTRFCFGDDESSLGDYAWHHGNAMPAGEKYARPVAGKKPNAWGLYDMHGNLWEWCSDRHDGKYYSNGKDTTDPAGPSSGTARVLRGGSFFTSYGGCCRSASRGSRSDDGRYADYGFRIVLSLDEHKTMTLDLGKGVTMKLALIPAGKFLMGSPDNEKDRRGGEGPQREVTISRPFYMGVYEVTQEQYETVMGSNPSDFKAANRPVEKVSWPDVTEFCRKLSLLTGKTVRLPTEAEWEYACRGGTATQYCSGDGLEALKQVGWCSYDGVWASARATRPVGTLKANPLGLYDMHGNVWEWCEDRYDAGYYAKAPNVDPPGPATGKDRVLRGGSWDSNPQACRSANRRSSDPPYRCSFYGFRVVVSIEERQTLTLDLGKDVTMKLALIPPGTFLMSSPDDEPERRFQPEGPRHKVRITKPFYMGIYEVTQAQYEAVMGTNRSEFKDAQRPVEMVSWNDAAEFCKRLSQKTGKTVRLPTEAEWEYACRAGTETRFSFGDNDADLHQYGNYADRSCTSPWDGKRDMAHSDGQDRTAPVGSYKPNAWGLYDMHGNVWEWCLDWYSGYTPAGAEDPRGPNSGAEGLVRGGSWFIESTLCRSAVRHKVAHARRSNNDGFRVVIPVEESEMLNPAFPKDKWVSIPASSIGAKAAYRGGIEVKGDSIITKGRTRFLLPLRIGEHASYEISYRFVRTAGNDTVGISIPVGSNRVAVLLSTAWGRYSGIDCIDGKGAEKTGTAFPGSFVNNRQYEVRVTVLTQGEKASIAVYVDGRLCTKWEGLATALSEEQDHACRVKGAISVSANENGTVFSDIRIRNIPREEDK